MRILLAALLTAGTAPGWGGDGHRIIARVAEMKLNERARKAVREILGAPMADVAMWADEVRPKRPETGPWHYVNIPLGATRDQAATFCAPGGCVTSRVPELIAVLRDPQAARAAREEALKFLIHFVGDLHQPLHASDRQDRGGNDTAVLFFGEASNLHRVWDSGILSRSGVSQDSWVDLFNARLSPQQVRKLGRGDVRQWVWESHVQARKVAYKRLPAGSPAVLDGAYQQRALRVVQEQLLRGSARLAAVLNGIWP